MTLNCESSDLLVFSHLRWDDIKQRPQHLLSRHAKHRRVFYFENPIFGMTELPRLHFKDTAENVLVVVPYLPSGLNAEKTQSAMIDLVEELIYEEELIDYSTWYYSPEALAFTRHLEPRSIIYDCLHFRSDDQEILSLADIVFTSGHALFEAKKNHHHHIHAFPSGIDLNHFSYGRNKLFEPDDQKNIPHPRLGYYGKVDEKINFPLIEEMARIRPEYQFILIGPQSDSIKEKLPKKSNIHYLDKKDYEALPLYLAGWDSAILPYAINESTKHISLTKALESLAAGKPVISTPILDIVNCFSHRGLVKIARTAIEFIEQFEISTEEKKYPEWIDSIDFYLKDFSWDTTFKKMAQLEFNLTHQNLRNNSNIKSDYQPSSFSEVYD